ncbi:hypothetical protein BGC07_14915 [Piscirickettsia litoralis]|uniref:Major facilitator superfamily (MFS) profile domain-containing protein n=2 Tax=Piscirickettsia litoralis TaxID=1891921 RepID=A0ABX3A501_9GAMM|nr:hypothetical protein BGC07_14915 [Piscirickettsia litoralis]
MLGRKAQFYLVISIATFLSMIFLDKTGLSVVISELSRSLHLTTSELQWVVNIYTLTLSMLLLICGYLSERLGVRRQYLYGVIIFLLASLLIAVCSSAWLIIVGRVIQGIGGSLAFATYLILISRYIPQDERGKVLGLCVGCGSVFLGIGPLIGGSFNSVSELAAAFFD